jgi:putative transposase
MAHWWDQQPKRKRSSLLEPYASKGARTVLRGRGGSDATLLPGAGEWIEAPTRQLKPSQRCPACWALAKKSLSDRTHACAQCGHTESRDLAAARVVLQWALGTHPGQELAETGANARETPSIAQHWVG